MNDDLVFVYDQCGMSIRSDIPIDVTRYAATTWDVNVRLGPETSDSWHRPPGRVIAEYGDGDTSWYTAAVTTDGYIIRFPGCGDFVVSPDISEVVVRAQDGGRSDLLPILLAGTVSAFLLSMRGATVLHASAVSVAEVALAFVGNSGQGKSTIAALMCAEGATLVADDIISISPGRMPTCRGGASVLRLRPQAAHLANAQPDRARRMTADDRCAFSATPASNAPHPLGAIVIPSPSRTATDLRVHAMAPSDAVFALMSMPRVNGWRENDVITRDFTTLGHIANRVPVYTATIPWGPPFDRDVAGALADLVAANRRG